MSEAIVNCAYLEEEKKERAATAMYNVLNVLDKVPSDMEIAQSVRPMPIRILAEKLG